MAGKAVFRLSLARDYEALERYVVTRLMGKG